MKNHYLLILFLQLFFCQKFYAQTFCESFDGTQIPISNKEQAFNIYGNGNSGFLQNWFVPSGTPSIYASGWLQGVNAYQGNQYALCAICDVAPLWDESLELQYNFVQGQSYMISFAIRNAPVVSTQPTPIDVDFILLPLIIPYTYNATIGCSPTPAVPPNAHLVHTIANYAQNSWSVLSFNTGALPSNYTYLWIRPKFSSGSPLVTTVLLLGSFCLKPSCAVSINLGNDTTLCIPQTLLLDAANPGSTYQWQDNSTSATYNVTSAGIYSVTVTDSANCTSSDIIHVTYSTQPPSINLGNDTTYCGNFSQSLSTTYTNTLWNNGVIAPQITISAPGLYWAESSNGCGSTRNSITINQNIAPQLALDHSTSICNDDSVLLQPTTTAGNFLWNTGSVQNSVYTSSPGLYWVEVWDIPSCRNRDSVLVTRETTPVFTLGNDTTVCGNEGVLLKVNIPDAQYHWQDNSTDSIYNVINSGIYSVTVSNNCGSANDEINVELHLDECKLNVPTAFTPNGDGINDLFRGISRCGTKQYSLHIFNRWGEQVFETQNVSDGWDGTYKSKPQPMGVFVYYIEYFNYCENKLKKIIGNVSLLR